MKEKIPSMNELTKQQRDEITQNSQAYIDMAVSDANKLWDKIRDTMKQNKNIVNWDDNKKIEYFYTDNKEFYKEFPIVCRYMITMGQYSPRAFAKYLKLKSLDAKNMPPVEKREKNYVEDQWIRREADYVRLLWKSYRNGNCTEHQSKMVWTQAYESLKEEFGSFRKNYKEIEDRLNEEKIKNQQQLTKEALERIIDNKPSDQVDKREEKGVIVPKQSDEDIIRKKRLKEVLFIKLIEQKKSKVLDELKKNKPLIAPIN